MVKKLREVLNRHAEELDNEDMQAIAKAEARAHKKSKSKHHKVSAKTNAELLAALRQTGQEESTGMYDEDDSMLPYDPELESHLGFGLTNKGLRSFEEFLKMIQDEKNLLDVKRIRNDIVTQIRKKKAQIGKLTYHHNYAYTSSYHLKIHNYLYSGSRTRRNCEWRKG